MRKQIMRRVTTRWMLTKKLPQVAAEFGLITFLVLSARPRIFFGAVFDNAYQAAISGPVSLAKFVLFAFANTTPGVKMLLAVVTVIGIMMVRDLYAARRYASILK